MFRYFEIKNMYLNKTFTYFGDKAMGRRLNYFKWHILDPMYILIISE